ncbi:MAG: response regulator [Deltaproteobacteria bacterium]|nr:response regulator [Deltaproteobacteria bacterium]MBW1737724.1 response regulator [Deltaproteobacteria bacterium]MBW1909793.1 response regulator [Deltaproteobacteria bacterium]MBW2033923.1 response regulator [Deltaproteobacteria bacterium]MBW2115263.1 response regulator [Deltaproteobacteria bacterium]
MEGIRLLLVDDEEEFRGTIAKRLTLRGISPEQAASGEECLSVLEKMPMDVVVLDVKMPGMSGIEALHHIKEKYPKTEVILLTGHATTLDGVEGIKAGAFDYLSKPIELDHLIGKIKHAYDKIRREEEKLKEAEFREKMEQQMIATERLASLGTLAAGVAHEINNPLAIIKESAGWMKLILKKDECAEIPRKQDFDMALNKIEKGVERAKRITLQLLGFARKDDSVLAELNLKELADEAIRLVTREAANKDIEIVQEMDIPGNTIWSDPYQLRQVLINLLTNAIHATGSGGNITIKLEVIGEEVALSVQDTGQGIPKENLERIFEPFFSTKSPGEGTGLGLFVTRGIVEKLGGKIEVESRLGHGTSFCIKLPKYLEVKEGLAGRDHTDILNKIIKMG